MSIIDRGLVKAINSGNCFVLIGAGASCELGFPNWKQLSENTLKEFESSLSNDEINQCKKQIANKNYPELFSRIIKKNGSKLVHKYIEEVERGLKGEGKIYSIISNWPFSCYLTTNFDDFIKKHLNIKGESFVVKRNSQNDMNAIRTNSRGLIYKLHGDTTVPDDIVLTTEQYKEFANGNNRKYWRDKLFSVLNMVDLVIIGYSVNDPDFKEQLERAKEIAAPDHPIYMFAPDFSREDIRDYHMKYNIRIIKYDNSNGDHQKLGKLLNRIDPFIAKRHSSFIGLEPLNEDEVTLASSMYLFSNLRLKGEDIYIIKIYSSLLLKIISKDFNDLYITKDQLREKLLELKFFSNEIDLELFDKALEILHQKDFITYKDSLLKITSVGKKTIEDVAVDRSLLKDKFYESCKLFLNNNFADLSNKQVNSIFNSIREGLIHAFQKRGIEIASSVYNGSEVDISSAFDILDLVNKASDKLENDEKTAYFDLMIEVLLRPDEITKQYLATLTQGYFSYHALALDSKCYKHRLDLAKKKNWIVDSSIILPLLAKGSQNHLYAVDLINKIKKYGLNCQTTEAILEEVHNHFCWAIENIDKLQADPSQLLKAATGGFGYKQNLIIAGFLNWGDEQGNPNFDIYLNDCLGENHPTNLLPLLTNIIKSKIGEVISFERLPELNEELLTRKDEYSTKIKALRSIQGTYKGDKQTSTEAEVIILNELHDSIFISQTTLLNKVSSKPLVCWTPEAIYRFLTLFSNEIPNEDLLHQCMTQDFFYSGFEVIDKNFIRKFATPLIKQSRMELKNESVNYENIIGKERLNKLLEVYEQQPDEDKLFYSAQLAYYIANKSTTENKSLREQIRSLEGRKKLDEKEKQEYIKLKTKRDEKKKKNKNRNKSKKKKK